MDETFFYLDEQDVKNLKVGFKIPTDKLGDYDRFLDGLKTGMVRRSRIVDNYGISDINEDALMTIVSKHGYDYLVVKDVIFSKKEKVKKK